MSSFGDQFLKKGLVSKQKLKQANTEKRVSAKKQPKTKKQKAESSDAIVMKQAKVQHNDKQEKIKQELEIRAKNAQIKDLLSAHQTVINREKATIKYYFRLGKNIDFLYIDKDLKQQLATFKIGITKFQEQYYLAPANIFTRLTKIDGSHLFYLSKPDSEFSLKGYENYPIPDDITW